MSRRKIEATIEIPFLPPREKCKAEIKPWGATRAHQCPFTALPNEDYCSVHLVMLRRLLERKEKLDKLFRNGGHANGKNHSGERL